MWNEIFKNSRRHSGVYEGETPLSALAGSGSLGAASSESAAGRRVAVDSGAAVVESQSAAVLVVVRSCVWVRWWVEMVRVGFVFV